jgi:hypothetical protein
MALSTLAGQPCHCLWVSPLKCHILDRFGFLPTSANYPKTILYQNNVSKLVVTYLKAQPKPEQVRAPMPLSRLSCFPRKIQDPASGIWTNIPNYDGQSLHREFQSTAFHMYPMAGRQDLLAEPPQSPWLMARMPICWVIRPAQNDLPESVTERICQFPITGATVQFTTATSATNLTAIR